ncbi:alpha-galactosidase [Kutzneria sp. NPDC051319]|uniref:alpha-galactosidase n=1 Tax=Kutzneria sp. NPDC051319 TaxID=3155047 RepID=UPI003415C922
MPAQAAPNQTASGGLAPRQANGVASAPQLGWSSWSFVRSNPTEANIEAQARAMHDSGLVAHGYTYLNIDDFYYLNPATTVDSGGRWAIDPARFPHGMAAVANYVHSQGEKFGMYLTPGIPVAAYQQNTPIEGTTWHARDIVSDTSRYETNYNYGNGSMYYIDYSKNPAAAQAWLNSWADQLASWGVDYIKLDGVGDWDIPDVQHWSQALNQAGRPIHFELSNSLALSDAATWKQYANGWRIEGDVECYCSTLTNWNNVAQRFGDLPNWTDWASAGGWNDPDSLEIGGSNTGLTADERRTAMTLWAVTASPITLGTDLTALTADDLSLLTNDEVLAVDQRGNAARPVDRLTQTQTWATGNADGSYTVALFNLTGGTATVTARWSDLGFGGTASVRDLWTHTDLGTATDTFSASLAPHASRLLRVVPAAGFHYTGMYYTVANANGALDVTSSADGSAVVQRPANGAATQQWQTVSTGAGTVKLVNRSTGRLLTVPNSTPGATLVQSHDTGSAAQWRVATGGAITSASNGLVAGAGVSSVVQTVGTGSADQQWHLTPVVDAGTRYKLVNLNSGGRVDVDNDSTADGANVLQWEDNERSDQLWTLNAVGNGLYTIVNANSGKLLNVPGASTTQGTQLIQYHDDGNANSRWRLVDAGPNRLGIVSASSGLNLDAYNNSLSDGAAIIQWSANPGANQKWTLVPVS